MCSFTISARRGERPGSSLQASVFSRFLGAVRRPGIALLTCGLALAGAALPSRAADAASTGTVRGRVQNADVGMYLSKARISVTGTTQETLTDDVGYYELANVPAGAVTLDVFYTGLQKQQVKVTVAAGQVLQQDFNMSAGTGVVKMDKFVVAAQRDTNAASIAINEQRFSANLKNVISTDAYGEISQGNIGEFVKHIPGVNIEFKDGNNPSGIDVRGFGTNYTRVTMDNNSVASAAIANTQTPNRQFVLEGASINNIARIEVTKDPLPDLPANSMGGAVNLVTKSAFEYAKPQETFSLFLNGNSYAMGLGKRGGITDHKTYMMNPNFDGSWVVPLSKTLGVVVSASNYDTVYIQKKNAPSRIWTSAGASVTNPYTRSFTAYITPNEQINTSGSIKLDWKPWVGTTFSLTTSATANHQDSAQRSITYSVGSNTPTSWDSTSTHGAVVSASTTSNPPSTSMGGSWQNRNALTRFIGGNFRMLRNNWTVELGATYSNAYNKIRDIDKGFFNTVSTSLAAFTTTTKSTYAGGSVNIDGFDNGTMSVGKVTAKTAAGAEIDTTKASNYLISTVGTQPATNYETVTEFRADIKRDFRTPWFPVSVKFGGSTNKLVRDLEYSASYWTYVGPDGVANSGDETAGVAADTNYAGTSPSFGLPGYEWVSPWKMYQLFKSHPEYFTHSASQISDQVKAEATRSPLIMERVTGLYSMADAKFFRNRLRLVGGVRFEQTHDYGYGYKQTASGYYKRATYNSRHYHDYFPSAALTYNVTQNFIARFAYAKTLGRPSPSDIVPNIYVASNASYTGTSGTYPGYITSNNTSLVPWTARNYDLTFEYYLPHNGMVSAGFFRKDIQKFFGTKYQIADAALCDALGVSQDCIGYYYTTRINVGDARIDGLELGYSQQLDFIPVVGRYFNFYANATKLRVLGQYATQFSFKNNGGNVPMSGNVGFGFTKDRLTVHLGWNYRGKQFRDTSSSYTNARENVLAYQTWDADMQYQLNEHFSLFAAGRNLSNSKNRWALEGPDAPLWSTVSNLYTNGIQYTFGVKGSF